MFLREPGEIKVTNRARQRFRAERTGVGAPLGELETTIMRQIWDCGAHGCLAADIQQTLNREETIALTTVLTTLDRLYDKGIVTREREGKAYRYQAAITEPELEQRIVKGVLNSLIARFPKAVATYFSEAEAENPRLSDLAHRVAETQRKESGTEENDV